MKKFDPNKLSIKEVYHIMISAIAPRPIAFVGSIDDKGKHNLAPYSFFNAFGANPPIVGFSPALSGRTGLPKDTLLNIKETKEFTISIVNSSIVEQISLSSCEFDKNTDEFIKSVSSCDGVTSVVAGSSPFTQSFSSGLAWSVLTLTRI